MADDDDASRALLRRLDGAGLEWLCGPEAARLRGAWEEAEGAIAAADSAGTELFLGSYPITPASDILHELSKYKHVLRWNVVSGRIKIPKETLLHCS